MVNKLPRKEFVGWLLVLFAVIAFLSVSIFSLFAHHSNHVTNQSTNSQSSYITPVNEVERQQARVEAKKWKRAKYYIPNVIHHDKYITSYAQALPTTNLSTHQVDVNVKPKYRIATQNYINHDYQFSSPIQKKRVTRISKHLNNDDKEITKLSGDKLINFEINGLY